MKTIKLTYKTTRRDFTGAPTAGTITARHRGEKVASCDWSGNLGQSAAHSTVIEQLRSKFDTFAIEGEDHYGEPYREVY